MEYPIDMSKPWFHGSPYELDILREGSTITQWRELAEAFATKPTMLEYGDVFGEIIHNGTEAGILYVIDEPISLETDIYRHPRTAMDRNIEFKTKRPLKLRRMA